MLLGGWAFSYERGTPADTKRFTNARSRMSCSFLPPWLPLPLHPVVWCKAGDRSRWGGGTFLEHSGCGRTTMRALMRVHVLGRRARLSKLGRSANRWKPQTPRRSDAGTLPACPTYLSEHCLQPAVWIHTPPVRYREFYGDSAQWVASPLKPTAALETELPGEIIWVGNSGGELRCS